MQKVNFSIFLILVVSINLPFAQSNQSLSKSSILEDLQFLDDQLQTISSYQGLNGYDYRNDLESFKKNISNEGLSQKELGIYLTKIIGKIGDRHASVRDYELKDEKYLPFSVAPLDGRVAALKYDRSSRSFHYLHEAFPFLTAINDIPIDDFLNQIIPEEIAAPKEAYFTRAVKELRDLDECFDMLLEERPDIFKFTFSGQLKDTIVAMPAVSRENRANRWIERFAFDAFMDLNDPAILENFFKVDENNIAYIRMPDMVSNEDAPNYFSTLQGFMEKAQTSQALIIDIRSNGGGTRDLSFELAKYLVHPNAIHIANVAAQRSDHELDTEQKKRLHSRYLFSSAELDQREQAAIQKFNNAFHPMYNLPKGRYAEYHYAVFNGQKMKGGYHFNRPVFILMNERCFSAASVMATLFKGLPNIKLVGVTTDGSSGNSEKFYLPNSKLRIKLSTMVSFQKDGLLLDGYGTNPDIEIKRDERQIFWERDTQLKKLKELIVVGEGS